MSGSWDVEQDDLRAQADGLCDGRRPVCRFADHVEPVRAQELARVRPESLVVVDDQHRVHCVLQHRVHCVLMIQRA